MALPDLPDLPESGPSDSPEASAAGPVAWKAAASSIPRLRQVAAAAAEPEQADAFPGFAQDELIAKAGGSGGSEQAARRLLAPSGGADIMTPAAKAPGRPWEPLLAGLRTVPPALLITAGVVVVAGIVTLLVLGRSGGPSVSLAQIRQHPEAWEGRAVQVRGVAGEVFEIGASHVFELRQSRDTIVVYSRTRRPSPNEAVAVTGTVSIGYLDGVPRVALLEDPTR